MSGLIPAELMRKEELGRRLGRLAFVISAALLASCAKPPADVRGAFNGAVDANPAPLLVDYNPSRTISKADGAVISSNRRVALVIGNGDYGQDIGQLINPTHDATDIAAALRRTGFEVHLLLNADRDDMQRAVLNFDQDLRHSDVGLFYYAGHAVQVNGRNFMVPMGAKLDISTDRAEAIADYVALETLEIDNVLGRMGNAETELSIVILDACRNNPFSQSSRGLSRGLAQTSAPRGSFIAYATSPGQVARDGGGKNSPYTGAIVKTLEQPGLKLEDVFKRVRQDVALQTNGQQIPWENSSVFGDFYFVDPVSEPEPRPIPSLSRNDYIDVQRLLTRIGAYHGLITGVPDQETRDAVIQWQTLHGLELDGEITKAQIPFLRTDALRVEDQARADRDARKEAEDRAAEQARTETPGRNDILDRTDIEDQLEAQERAEAIARAEARAEARRAEQERLASEAQARAEARSRADSETSPRKDPVTRDASETPSGRWNNIIIPPPPA